ncbi:MAG: hypothetical protein IKP77_07575 [Acholeplasmatales bacterium]|nr:hypothetical protein [Acholeplasmatales bacterium]
MEDINLLMNNFISNRNILAKINTELTNTFGKEYYLSSLSNTLIEAFNSFEKFYGMMDDKLEFAKMLDDVSNSAVDFFNIKTKENLGKMSIFKKKRILKKSLPENQKMLNDLLNKIDLVNDFITKNVEEYVKNNQ